MYRTIESRAQLRRPGVDRRPAAGIVVGVQGLIWTIAGLHDRVTGRASGDQAVQRQGSMMVLIALAAFAAAVLLLLRLGSARPLAGIVEVLLFVGGVSALVTAPGRGLVELASCVLAVALLIAGTATARFTVLPPPLPQASGGAAAAARRGPRTSAMGVVLVLSLVAVLVAGLLLRQNLIFGLAVAALLIVPVEHLLPVRRQRILRDQWLSDLVHFVANGIVATVGVVAAAALLVAITRPIVSPQLAQTFAAWPSWVQLVVAVVLADVAGYWAHRATHQIGWLWRFHAVHHSIEEMDWLASGRLHPLDQVWGRAWGAVALVALGVTRETFGLWLVVLTFLAVFQHANVRLDLGPFRWFVANPQVHHWHHANHLEAVNTNFSGALPLLDVAFGTAWCPAHEWPRAYGSPEPVPDNWWAQLAFPFRRSNPMAARTDVAPAPV